MVRQHQIFQRVSLQKIWCSRTAVFSVNGDSEGRFESTQFSEVFRFRKFGAIEPLCFPKMRTAKGVSIAPNFPKCFVSEDLLLSNPSVFRR